MDEALITQTLANLRTVCTTRLHAGDTHLGSLAMLLHPRRKPSLLPLGPHVRSGVEELLARCWAPECVLFVLRESRCVQDGARFVQIDIAHIGHKETLLAPIVGNEVGAFERLKCYENHLASVLS